MKLRLHRMSIGAKLTALSSALVVLCFALFTYVAISSMTRASDDKSLSALSMQTDQVLQMMRVYDSSLRQTTELASSVLVARFPDKFSLDTTTTIRVGGVDTPALRSGDRVLNNDFTVVDELTRETGVAATVFARKGDDLVRVTTSLKKQDGTRGVGTALDHQHPAYDKLLAGETFTGKAKLFGKDYMTRYVPVRDAAGRVIGALFIGSDFTEGLKELAASVRALRTGETGYFYVVDAAPGAAQGTLVIHPAKEGTNILDARDSDGREFIKEIVQNKKGVIRYPWLNKELGDKAAREKIVVYGHFAAWDWVVGGGSYVEEFSRASVQLRNKLVACAVGAVLLLSALLYWAARRLVSAPLKQAVAIATRVGAGDLSSRIAVERGDEIGQLMQALEKMSENLTTIVTEVRSGTDAIAVGSEAIAGSLEGTAASMEELSGTVKENAQNARHANELAVAASAVAVKGGAVVEQVVSTMSSINHSSNKIADIIGVIDEIAFQTNILALNAAVEAARAGEQGRGFAVVASEVRSLAQRSASAAREIKHLISDSVQRVEVGTRLVAEAGKTMGEIVSSVKSVTDIMAEISSANGEQGAGAQAGQGVTLMDRVTQQNAVLVEQAAAAAETMREQASSLEAAVSVFKLREETRGEPEPARDEGPGVARPRSRLTGASWELSAGRG